MAFLAAVALSDATAAAHAAGPPQATEVGVRDATQTTVTIEAKIDPNASATSYHFEWGPTTAYGNDVPADIEGFAGSGSEPVLVTAKLSGLSAASTYHYRLVARNSAGTVSSPDSQLETLDSCELPEGRCLEMVSPRDSGLVAAPGRHGPNKEMLFQASEQPGSLAYESEMGTPEATRGGEILYLGNRTATGWSSYQLSPPVIQATETNQSISPSQVLGLSANLNCGVVASSQPLTEDPVGRLVIEGGGANLYRRNADGSYTLITDRPPEPLEATKQNLASEFEFVGMSTDCSRIYFESEHVYSNVVGAGTHRLYEWAEGQLRSAGWAPSGGGGEASVEAIAGATPANGSGVQGNWFNAVSDDGSRVFFQAKRLTAPLAAEIGKTGVFVREDGAKTVDVSASETSTPDTGATFQGATPDGSKVYFSANAGLTTVTSSEGTDLYQYDFSAPESERLTDLSVDGDSGGAQVGGSTGSGPLGALVGLSTDGSQVYFIARGQLVPGAGKSLSENQASQTFSLYLNSNGIIRFVTTVGGSVDQVSRLTKGIQLQSSSVVSASGRYLLFESSLPLTGYPSEGQNEAFLFDSQSPIESLRCVSCRRDGEPPYPQGTSQYLLAEPLTANNRNSPPQSLLIRGGAPTVFFKSKNPLTPGVAEGEGGLYEWVHSQVFHIASEAPGSSASTEPAAVEFAGTSGDGSDLYFTDAAALNWENMGARFAAWDARTGGGFGEPPAAVLCNPNAEGVCQSASAHAPPEPVAGTTASQAGNAKVTTKKHHKKKHHKKKHHKKKHHKKKRRAGK